MIDNIRLIHVTADKWQSQQPELYDVEANESAKSGSAAIYDESSFSPETVAD